MSESVISPNDFSGSDVARINQAVSAASQGGGRVRIPRLNRTADGVRDHWLLDSAILLPSNTTLELDGCRIKLADTCRDNIIRSANCGEGMTDIQPAENIHIIGQAGAVLEGADRPRSTGDGGEKLGPTLHELPPGAKGLQTWVGGESFGTDAGLPGEKQTGDWRNLGILMASVRNFSIRNLALRDTHCWAISLERCSDGHLSGLHFESEALRMIDGSLRHLHNLDGIDLRQGCHDITIEDITGYSGDDLIALTAIPYPSDYSRPAGCLDGSGFDTMISDMKDPGDGSDDIRNIIIRNVRGHCSGGHHVVRLLNTRGLKMHDILIDGVIDTAVDNPCRAVVLIGDADQAYGGMTTLGDTSRVIVRNVLSWGHHAVLIAGSLSDSIIDGVIQQGSRAVTVEAGDRFVRNVSIQNVNVPD